MGNLALVLCLQIYFSFLFCSCLPQMALTQVTVSSSQFFSVELVEQRHSSQGRMDVCGEASLRATWGRLFRSEVSLPAALPVPFLGRKRVIKHRRALILVQEPF